MRAIGKAKELCAAQQVNDAEFEVVEGDARDVLCDAVDRHNAEMLAVGSHAYGAFKRYNILPSLLLCLLLSVLHVASCDYISTRACTCASQLYRTIIHVFILYRTFLLLRVVLGSVSDHCTHNAGCTVITVKKKPQDDPSSTYK